MLKQSRFWVVTAVSGGLLCGLAFGVFFGLTHDLPQIRSLESFQPSAVSRLYSTDKELLAGFFHEHRDPVPLAKIPPYLVQALLATEDRQFYQHIGFNLKAILRAAIKNMQAGKIVEGASTISQQLAKTLFLTPRKTLGRKMKEALLAYQLERRYTKNEILAFYLNQVYFGSGAYGVQSAARIFFGKAVQDLDLSECALIAGMPKSPSRYSPLVNTDLALKRRNVVLKQMADTGVITPAAYRAASAEILPPPGRSSRRTKAPYFVEYVRRQLEEVLGPAKLYRGGLTIISSLHYRDQLAAEAAISRGLAAIAGRAKKNEPTNQDLQGALIALDVGTGGIRAMVGGRDFLRSPFNRATEAVRQPGSAFKPFVYACAVENGYAQNHLILDAPVVFKGARAGDDWRPENYSRNYDGEITLRRALVNSKNIPAVRLTKMVGPDAVAKFSRACGISTPLTENLTLALGTSGVTLLDLTAAYAVFPNRGEWTKPWSIAEIRDSNGRMIRQAKAPKRVVMSRSGAAILTDMLVGVIHEGTGGRASALKWPLAGKTGTTDGYRDALFVGFSPSIVCGVWVGRDRPESLGAGESGARAALPIWVDYMREVLPSQPVDYFDIPDDVVRIRIDPVSGRRVAGGGQAAVFAMFQKGTEP